MPDFDRHAHAPELALESLADPQDGGARYVPPGMESHPMFGTSALGTSAAVLTGEPVQALVADMGTGLIAPAPVHDEAWWRAHTTGADIAPDGDRIVETLIPEYSDAPLRRSQATGHQRHRGDLAATVAGLGAGAWVATALMTGWDGREEPGGWLTLGGSVAAMLGTYLALIAVLLASRLPWLEREVGHDRMIAWHRTVGPATLLLITAHVVLTMIGWSIAEGVGPIAELTGVILEYPSMMPAFAAFVIMLTLGLSSMRRVRRKMRYETWHVAHLYFYLAILLAYAHQVVFGQMFTEHPAIATAWLAMYVLVFGTVIVCRFISPVVFSLRHRLVVDEIVEEVPGIVSVYIRGRKLDKLKVKGGQFCAWRFMTRNHWWQAHPYSLSAGGNGEVLRITVKALGDHSTSLRGLKPGTRVIAEGPYGVFTADKRHSDIIVGFAAGVGITPLRALMDDLPDHADVTLIYRVRNEEDLALRAELDHAASKTGWKMIYLTGENGQRPFTPEFLTQLAPRIQHSDVFICGPGPFTGRILTALDTLGLEDRNIHYENFAF